jgi:imidazole glycerol-phosphate synthase subunit HisF
MQTFRLISRLDIKGPNLIKGVQLEGLRVIGDPAKYAKKYYDCGIDELIYIDVVASLYGRNTLLDVVKNTSLQVFVPLTVGGGIRMVDDVEGLLRAGADKVCLNTAAIKDKFLISEIANRFGSQCCVVEVQGKRTSNGKWTALFDNGRENSGLDAVSWASEAVDLGAGEVLVTSVDQEGTRSGMDIELIKLISAAVDVPVISSGGVGAPKDIISAYYQGGVDAVAVGDILHNNRYSIQEIKHSLDLVGISVRL